MPVAFRQIEQSLQSLLTAFMRRRRHEQVALATLAGLLGLWIIVAGMVEPALAYSHRAKNRFDQERARLAWIQQHSPEVRQMTAARPALAASDTSLLALASTTSKAFDLSFQRFEPGTDGKLALWLSDTEFNQLLSWLDAIVREQAVQIDHLVINQSAKAGSVETQIVLRHE